MSDTSITLSKLITPEDVRKAGWATEKTLNKLLEAMTGEKSTPAPLTQAEKEAAENARLAREESKKNRSVMGLLSDSVAGTKKAFAGTGDALENAIKRGFGSPSDMLSTFGGTVATVGKNLQSETGNLKSFGIGLGYLSVAVYDVSQALGKMIQTNTAFLGVYDSGIRLEGGLQGLMIASQGAGMDVAEFGQLLSKHSTTVAMLGSTRTPDLIKKFQDLTNRGSELMMTQGQANEAFMQTTEIFQQTGAMAGMSLENLGKSSKILIEETNLLSKETGQSRKSILDFVSSVTKSGSSYLLLSTMGKGAGENFAYAAAQATRFGQTFGKTLTDNMQKFMAGNGSLGLLDENFRMLANLVPGASDAFADLNKATAAGDKDGIKNATERFGKALADTPEPLKKQLLMAMPELAEILGDASKNQALLDKKKEEDAKADAAEAKKLNVDLSIVTQRRIDREEKEEADNIKRQRQLNEVDAATKNLSTEFTRMWVSMAQVVLPTLGLLAKTINNVIEGFQKTGSWIGKNIFGQDEKEADTTGGVSGLVGAAAMAAGSWGGAKLLGKGYGMAKGMASKALGMGEDIPLPGASGERPPSPGGRRGGAGAGGAGGAAGPRPGRPGLPGPGAPPAPGAGGGGIIGSLFDGLGKLGPMLSSIGKGAGDAIKGILTGIGQGLSALGNTSVLKGVVALGGISASMWVAAKAFQEFNKVEWGSMAKAAVAITGIGAAAWAVGQKSTEIIKGGTALGIAVGAIGLGLMAAGTGLQMMEGISWETLITAGGAIGIFGGAALLANQNKGGIIGGGLALGVALGAIGLAMMAAGTALQMMEGISWETMGKAGAVILALGAASALVGLTGVGPLAVAAGGLALGVAIGAIGLAMQAAGTGLKIMEDISWDSLGKAGVAIGALSVIAAAAGVISPLIALGGMALGSALTAIGMGMESAGSGLKIMEDISWDSLGKAGVAIGALSVIAAAAGVISPLIALGGMALGKAIGAIGTGMESAGPGLKIMKEISWDSLGKAGVAIGALSVIAAAAGVISPLIALGGIALGKAIGAIGHGMMMAGPGLKIMEEISWESMAKAGVAIGALSVIAAAAGVISPLIALGGIALGKAIGAIGLSMQAAGTGLKIMEEISWDSLGKAGVAIGAIAMSSMAVGVVAPLVMQGGIALGKAIGAIGHGMMMAGPGLKIMKEISWESMAKAGVAIGAIAMSSMAVGVVAPLVMQGGIALGKAIGAIGHGMMMAGSGLKMMEGVSWGAMAKAGVAISALGVAAAAAGLISPLIESGGAALGTAMKFIGEGLGMVADTLAMSLENIAGSIQQFANIDGNSLVDTGKGMLALAGGLTVMSAGSLIGSLANFADGMLNFFREDPITKLKRFAEVGEPLRIAAESMDLLATSMPKVLDTIGTLNNVDFSGTRQLKDAFSQMPSGGVVRGLTTNVNQSVGTQGGAGINKMPDFEDRYKEVADSMSTGINQDNLSSLQMLQNTLSGKQGMSTLYSDMGKSMMEFGTGYKETVNALNMPISQESLSNVQSLTDILMGKSPSSSMGQESGFNFAESTASYYDNSQSYYNSTLVLFRDMRDSSMQMSQDIASIKNLTDTMMRRMAFESLGSAETAR